MALPELGMRVVALMESFNKAKKRYIRGLDEMRKKTADMARSVEESTKFSAKGFEALDSKVVETAKNMGRAMVSGLGRVGFNLLASAAKSAAAEILDSVNAFQQAAQELRRFQLQMGGSTTEISRFLQAAQSTGASMSGVASGLGIFEKKLTDTSLRMAVGSEESHEFARAMGALGVDIKNADGSIRTLESIMPQISDAFAQLGPGAFTTGLAMDIFGRAGKDLLPVLLAGSDAMKKSADEAERLGAVMTSKDVKASEELREATKKLDTAIQGFKNTIARQVIPFLVALKNAAADVINTIRQLGIMAQAVSKGLEAWKMSGLDSAAFTEAFNKSVEASIGALTQEEAALEAAKLAQEKRNQEVADAMFERLKTLEKIDELNQGIKPGVTRNSPPRKSLQRSGRI
ncbi:MAG: hypothetical protein ACYTEW_27470 [Planctomycetota bacterium]